MGASVVKVLIVDDNAEARENIRRLLSFEPRIMVVAEAENGAQAVDRVEKYQPDVVLMDINMPVMDGILATERITRKMPTTYVVMISVQNENDYLRKAMLAGAKEYLSKPFTGDQLIQTVLGVYDLMVDKQASLYANHVLQKGYVEKPQTLTVFSGKGGVGKTSLVVNGALSLAKQRKKVLIVDLDLFFGDACIQLDLNPQRTVYQVIEDVARFTIDDLSEYVLSHPSGVDVLPAPLKLEEAELVTGDVVEKMLRLFRERYDFILIDTAPVVNEAILGAFDQSDAIYLVSTPHLSVLHHNKKVLDVLRRLEWEQDRLKLLVNRVNLDAGVTLKDVQQVLQMQSAILFPEEKRIDLATNRGEPLYLSKESSPWVKKIDQWTDTLVSKASRSGESTPQRGRKKWFWSKEWA